MINQGGKISFLQIFFIGLFCLFAIVFFVLFATSRGIGKSSNDNAIDTVVIWGTLINDDLNATIDRFNSNSEIQIRYFFKTESAFSRDFVQAIATRTQPDLVLLPHELILKHGDVLGAIPYKHSDENLAYSRTLYENNFMPATNIFLFSGGILAFPLAVDPIVAYYNKDLLSSIFVANPPRTWDGFVSNVLQSGTKRDGSIILQSAIPLGESRNITNFKDILSALLLQSGSRIVYESNQTNTPRYLSDISNNGDNSKAINTTNFYTSFSNPSNRFYTWNGSISNDKLFFASGQSVFYLGFASEYGELLKSAPNLNIGATIIPQLSESDQATFGRVYGFATPRVNRSGKIDLGVNTFYLNFAQHLIFGYAYTIERSSQQPDGIVVYFPNLIPTSVSAAYATQNLPTDPVLNTNYRSVIISKNWLDFDANLTERYFQELVENTTTGVESLESSVEILDSRIENILPIR